MGPVGIWPERYGEVRQSSVNSVKNEMAVADFKCALYDSRKKTVICFFEPCLLRCALRVCSIR